MAGYQKGVVLNMMNDGDLALALWRCWFQKFGEPWVDIDGGCYCLFCDGENDKHEDNCVWLQARELVTKQTVTRIPEFS